MRTLILLLCTLNTFGASSEALRTSELEYIKTAVRHYAKKHKIDHNLVLAVIYVESSMRPLAKGAAGEVGLMQLHPRWFPDASYQIKQNVQTGIKHLAYMKKYCKLTENYSWIICYNRGFVNKTFDFKNDLYYNKVMKELGRLK